MKCFLSIALALTFSLAVLSSPRSEETIKQSIGARFHHETSAGDTGMKGKDIAFGKSVPLYKVYEGARKVKLPPASPGSMSVEKAISERKSTRSYTRQSLSLARLAQVLLSADGITEQRGSVTHRAAPSAGALYPMEIYLIATRVDSLPSGLYHFQVRDSSLELMRAGVFGDSAFAITNEQDAVQGAPVTLFLTARFDRVTIKYADRGYRYAYVEAGAVCQNVYLEATSLGLGTVVMGAFNDDDANKFLGIDGQAEATLLVMPVGYPAE